MGANGEAWRGQAGFRGREHQAMKLILPLIFTAIAIGLFSNRMTAKLWFILLLVMAVIIGHFYIKN
jgi:hypothetical protein